MPNAPRPLTPDPELVARFRRDAEAARGAPIAAGERIGIAVSGGPDSMALLALAAAAFPGQVIAATVDHRLRPDSADEAAMVARWCAASGIAHATLALEEPPQGNLHAWARTQRYRALAQRAVADRAALVMTAHHADDQAETLLMRANRGVGVTGLAGVRARQWLTPDGDLLRPSGDGGPAVDLVRPLLGWRRGELRGLVEALDMPFVIDPSNDDPRFERARIRALLAGGGLDPAQLARTAARIAEADADWRDMAALLWHERRREDGALLALDVAGLPRELRRRLARAAIEHVRTRCEITRPAFDDATNIEPLLDALEAGSAATQAGVIARPHGSIWRFDEAPPRRSL